VPGSDIMSHNSRLDVGYCTGSSYWMELLHLEDNWYNLCNNGRLLKTRVRNPRLPVNN
jgi:hypothetical protein